MWIIAVPKGWKHTLNIMVFGSQNPHLKSGLMKRIIPPRNPSPPPIETPDPPVLTPKWGLKTGGCFDTPNPTSQGFLGPGFFSAYRFCPTNYQPKKPEVFHGVFLPIGSMGRLYIYLTWMVDFYGKFRYIYVQYHNVPYMYPSWVSLSPPNQTPYNSTILSPGGDV